MSFVDIYQIGDNVGIHTKSEYVRGVIKNKYDAVRAIYIDEPFSLFLISNISIQDIMDDRDLSNVNFNIQTVSKHHQHISNKQLNPIINKQVTPIIPSIHRPKVQSPFQIPSVQIPSVQSPKVQSPKVQSPKVQSPSVQSPKVQSPSVQSPKVQIPSVQSSKVQSSKVQSPAKLTGHNKVPEHMAKALPAENKQINTEMLNEKQSQYRFPTGIPDIDRKIILANEDLNQLVELYNDSDYIKDILNENFYQIQEVYGLPEFNSMKEVAKFANELKRSSARYRQLYNESVEDFKHGDRVISYGKYSGRHNKNYVIKTIKGRKGTVREVDKLGVIVGKADDDIELKKDKFRGWNWVLSKNIANYNDLKDDGAFMIFGMVLYTGGPIIYDLNSKFLKHITRSGNVPVVNSYVNVSGYPFPTFQSVNYLVTEVYDKDKFRAIYIGNVDVDPEYKIATFNKEGDKWKLGEHSLDYVDFGYYNETYSPPV